MTDQPVDDLEDVLTTLRVQLVPDGLQPQPVQSELDVLTAELVTLERELLTLHSHVHPFARRRLKRRFQELQALITRRQTELLGTARQDKGSL